MQTNFLIKSGSEELVAIVRRALASMASRRQTEAEEETLTCMEGSGLTFLIRIEKQFVLI